MADKKVKVINNSNALKRIAAANVRLDPGINELTPPQYEKAKQTAAWDDWKERGEIELWEQNQHSTGGQEKPKPSEYTIDDIPMHDFKEKEQDKERQKKLEGKYKDEDWLKKQILGAKANGMSRTEAIEHIAEWCGVTARTVRRYAP